jgi:glucose/arabinose dehydrogenase
MSQTTKWLAILAICIAIGVGLVLGVGLFSTPSAARAQGNATWPTVALFGPLSGFDWPVHIAHAGDGSGRIFVVERPGRIRIVKNGQLLLNPFLDITGRILSTGNEQGLLSVAFSPGYASQGHFYVDYTDLLGNTVIARYAVTADPDVADPNSEQLVLTVNQPYANHNGGQLAFGPNDGYLYVGMGDGGDAGDPGNNAQNPTSLLGKLLRIDVETGSPLTYTVPATNPFTQTVGYRPEIWALGLRNPWRFSFDRQTGDLYIGDVGQALYEEVDVQLASSPGGENYGWNIMEGFHCYAAASCDNTGLTLPVLEYPHAQGDCSVTGGTVYRGTAYALMDGVYVYADYCSGRVWGLRNDGSTWQSTLLLDTPFQITSFGEDEIGNIWLTRYAGAPDGAIYRLAQAWSVYLPLIVKQS